MAANDGTARILVRLDDRIFALPTLAVREMLACPRVTALPGLPRHARGLLNLRGEVVPLIDLRCRLGLRSRLDELAAMVQMLHEREADHVRWVETLTSCVREGRELTLQTDPHLCAFGRWLYAYHTSNRVLAMALARFEKPHAAIHEAAVTIRPLIARKDAAAVEQVLCNVQHDLALMRRLFQEARETLASSLQEIVVVIDAGGRAFGITVDQVESVEPLRGEELPPRVAGAPLDAEGLVSGVARRTKDDATVLLLDPLALARELEPVPA